MDSSVSIPIQFDHIGTLMRALVHYEDSIKWSGLAEKDDFKQEELVKLKVLVEWTEAAWHLVDMAIAAQRAKERDEAGTDA